MRKLFLTLTALFIVFFASAQVRLGLRFSPNLSINRIVEEEVAAFDVSKNGAGIRFSAGPFLDLHFADKYAFHTGIWFSSRRAGLEVSDTTGSSEGVFSLQYVQLPVGIKFFTGDFGTDMRLYFLLGGTFDIKVADKFTKGDENLDPDEDFAKTFDATIFVGAGLEMDIGTNNILFGGISYNRGLMNAIKDKDLNDDLSYKSDFLSLDLGIKF